MTLLWEHECTIQRRHQKLIEIGPSPAIPEAPRYKLLAAAIKIAQSVRYTTLGTFEFLVGLDGEEFAFIEANPRLQVEHTVTEEVSGVDLVETQLELAFGRSLQDLDLAPGEALRPRSYAIELRINAESMAPDGGARFSSGTITVFEPPSGTGLASTPAHTPATRRI